MAPSFTSTPVSAAVEGSAYRYAVAVTGQPTPTVTGTTLPGWLKLEDNVLSGTPSAKDVGSHEVTLTAKNGVSPDAVQTFNIEVVAETIAPTFTSDPTTEATEGVRYAYEVKVSGKPTPTITATDLPSWLTLEANVLSGTPAYAHGGSHEVVLNANNGIQPVAVQTFTINVATVSTAPEFTSTAVTAATEGQEYAYTVAVSGTPMPTVTATTLPSWLQFDAETMTLSGTPSYADRGEHPIVLTASNGIDPDAVHTFTVTVATVSTAPLFTSTPVTAATEGQAYAYTPSTAAIPDATITATTLPSWLTFDGTTLMGMPAWADGGEHQIVLTASNGIDPDAEQSFTLIVTTVSVAPAITSTPVTAAMEDSAYTYTVVATGTPTPTFALTGPAGGPAPSWLSIDATTGVLSGTPGAAQVGSQAVRVTASNGIPPAAEQIFTIDVERKPVAPTITSTAVTSVRAGQLYSYTVSATGFPAPTFSATLAGGAALPSWLSLDPATGVLSGTPTGPGTLDLEITATNGVMPNATQSFTLNIASASVEVTSTALSTGQVGVPWSYTVTTSGTPTPTLTVSGMPSWMSFDGQSTLSGIPTTAGITGNITLTASNGVSASGTQTFTIDVAPMAPIAVAGNPYVENFTAGTLPPGWSVTGGSWAVGIPTTGTASQGPPSVFDGPLVATNPTGNYTNKMHARLQTPRFDLTGVAQPVLRFVHWYNFEPTTSGSNRYDGGNIKISTDGGATWSALDPQTVVPAYTGPITSTTNVMTGQLVWAHSIPGWQAVVVDLGANLAGLPLDQVSLQFEVGTDGSTVLPGWYIDSLRVGDSAEVIAPAIVTSKPSTLNLIAGQRFEYPVVVSSNPAPVVTLSGDQGGAPPAWLSFDPATGLLSGVPTDADAGANIVELHVSNGEPPAYVQRFTVTVTAAQTLVGYDFEVDVNTPAVVDTNVTASNLAARVGTPSYVGGHPGRALTSNSFHDPANPNYFEFTVTPITEYHFVPSELLFDHYRSATGPTTYAVSMVVNGVETPLVHGAGSTGNATTWQSVRIPFTIAEASAFTSPVTIRITGSGTSASGGTWRIDNVSFRGLSEFHTEAPTITSTAITTASADTAYSYEISATGAPAPTITVSGLPTWLTYSSTTRTISGTPTRFNVGTTGTITVTASNNIGTAAKQTFTIAVSPPAALPVVSGTPYVETFGTTAPAGWAFDGDWEFGTPTTGTATQGPPSVHDGSVAATRLNGDYSASSTSRLVTPVLDLTGITNPKLTFVHWFNLERSSTSSSLWDGGNIKISTDGGATWSALILSSVVPSYTGKLSLSSMSGQQAWSGTIPAWEIVTVDLDANLASLPLDKVVLRFDMASDSSGQLPGWYLDDVKIGASADL